MSAKVNTKTTVVDETAASVDTEIGSSASLGIRAGFRVLSQDRLLSEALIRKAFDETFFSSKYRRRFIGRTLEPHEVALETYLRFVTRDQLDPNGDFSEDSYLRDNPDIMEGVTTGRLLCGFEHWLRYGKAEGRPAFKASMTDEYSDPIFKEFSAAFFSRKYRRRFSGRDLQHLDTALSLYVSFVGPDCLDPNPNFSESDYLRENPDVKDAVERGILASGFAHWATFGRKEGRKANPAFTFDGAPSGDRAIIISNPRSDPGIAPLCLSREEFGKMLRYFDKNFFKRTQKHDLPAAAERVTHRMFHVYLNQVATAPVDPSPHFSESHYLECNSDIASAVRDGGYLCGYHHWVLHGRAENRVFRSSTSGSLDRPSKKRPRSTTRIKLLAEHRSLFRRCFQFSYYKSAFPMQRFLEADAAFDHFMDVDLMRGVVPVDQNTFDEDFYVCYYGDVQVEKAAGRIPSGYFHYVLSGHSEGRLPTYRAGPLLKAKLGDSADPIGIANVGIIAKRIRPMVPRILTARPIRMNVFIPALDGDLMFGGYIAFLNFLCRVAERGVALRFIIREDPYGNAAWFLRSIGNRPRWLKVFGEQEVVNATVSNDEISFNSGDLCIAYSTWTMFDAWSVARHLEHSRPLFFIQEYEPIFHDHNSFGFVMSSAYRLPHLAIFNSSILARYFQENQIGAFAGEKSATSFTFENPLTPFQTLRRMVNPVQRKLLCYTRPERHAGRNMFEVCILALREAVEKNVFLGGWDFLGVGSLGHEYEIELGGGKVLSVLPRMPQADYEQFLLSFDVGLSLMWAPHPSVMPFELAAAGVVTVTNEYTSRRGDAIDRFGTNLILAVPTIDGIVTALREAVCRSEDLGARRAASSVDWPRSWDEVFPAPFTDEILAAART